MKKMRNIEELKREILNAQSKHLLKLVGQLRYTPSKTNDFIAIL